MGTAIAGGGVSYALPQAVEIGPVEIDDPNGVVSDELVFGTDSMAFYSLDCVGKVAGTSDFLPQPGPVVATARRIVDRRVLHLIKMWLDCPVEETNKRGRKTRTAEARDSRRGIAEGSPLSPLLANLYMCRFVLG